MNFNGIKEYLKNHTIDCVIDTDTFNEIDDQFALTYLLKNEERLNVKAIYAAPFLNHTLSKSAEEGMLKSYDEVKRLLNLMNYHRLDNNIYKGSTSFMTSENKPINSEAANHLAKLAANYSSDNPLFIIAIGAITNIASAILINPELADKVVLIWLGGTAYHVGSTLEFNMIQDIAAARVCFEKYQNIVLLPCEGVVSEFSTTIHEVEHFIGGKNPICDYLCHILSEVTANNRATSRVIWDVTAVAWLLNDNNQFMLDEIIPMRMPGYFQKYEDTLDNKTICYVKKIFRDELYTELFEKLSLW